MQMQVKLYVVSHKKVEIPSATYLYPICSNRTDKDNIAQKINYCELRAQYWVWKNEQMNDTDYVGFFHYRRYLDLNKKFLLHPQSKGKHPIPYRIQKRPNVNMYSDSNIKSLICNYDVIAPVWEYTGVSVWNRYQNFKGHQIQNLYMIYQIIADKYPEFLQAANNYLSGKGEYYGNIYIMRWNRFQKYCSWVFNILDEFDRRTPNVLPFTNGYLGERLFGIYFTWLQEQKRFCCGECPRIHFFCYDDESHQLSSARILNLLLPPGTRQRACIKRIIKSGKGR